MAEEKPKRKMRPGGGKAKGNGFEGQIAKKLSTALAPLNFMRSPGSGARVGGKNFEKFGEMFGEEALAIFVADVVPINEKKRSSSSIPLSANLTRLLTHLRNLLLVLPTCTSGSKNQLRTLKRQTRIQS